MDNPPKLSKQLLEYRTGHTLAPEEMAYKLGVSPRTYYNYESGTLDDNVIKSKKVLRKLAENMQMPAMSEISYTKNKGVPVYAMEATAGDMNLSGDIGEPVEGYINLPNFRKCSAFLYVRGNSMYPKLQAGDLIGVQKIVDIEVIQFGQVYLIITTDNQRMIKIIFGEDDHSIILRSANKEFGDIKLKKAKVLQLFMVKGPIRDDWQ